MVDFHLGLVEAPSSGTRLGGSGEGSTVAGPLWSLTDSLTLLTLLGSSGRCVLPSSRCAGRSTGLSSMPSGPRVPTRRPNWRAPPVVDELLLPASSLDLRRRWSSRRTVTSAEVKEVEGVCRVEDCVMSKSDLPGVLSPREGGRSSMGPRSAFSPTGGAETDELLEEVSVKLRNDSRFLLPGRGCSSDR